MAGELYLEDSYLSSCTSKVISIRNIKHVVLDRTVFFPRGGGLPWDLGAIIRLSDHAVFNVKSVTKSGEEIFHEIEENAGKPTSVLQEGNEVECKIDWQRRYRLMRMHTAGHVLAAIMYRKMKVLITGNQIEPEKARFDFSMQNFDKNAFQLLIDEANTELMRNHEVSIFFLPRDEALKIEGAVKLASALPPSIQQLRMVKIGDIDCQADGGPHVRNTSEVGRIVFLGAENKGKNNRRVVFTVEP